MKRKILSYTVLAGIAFVGLWTLFNYYGGSTVPSAQQPLVRLDSSSVASLKTEFNASVDSVRLLVLVSPT